MFDFLKRVKPSGGAVQSQVARQSVPSVGLQTVEGGSWVRRFEHLVLRVVSFVFAVGGAYAFASFFAPLDKDDPIQAVITVSLSVALGLASYFLSRGIADRLMAVFGEEGNSVGSVWSLGFFVPLFLVCEFLEIFTNYAKAIPAVHDTAWLSLVPSDQRSLHVLCTYLVYCVVPLVSPCLAAVDMALERGKLRGRRGQSSAVVPPVVQRAQQQAQQRQAQQSGRQSSSSSVPPRQSQQVRSSVPPLSSKQAQGGPGGNPPLGVMRQPLQPQTEPEPELGAVV